MISLEQLSAVGATLVQQGLATQWHQIAYDSRLARPGELFVALQTERADGHAFIEDACRAGVTGILCVEPPGYLPAHLTVLTTDHVLDTLARWAAQQVHALQPLVVAVTGSVGKTSTKRAIATLLSGYHPTFMSPRSFNTILGLAVALTDLQADQRWAVLEFGADRRGEIEQLAALFPPQIGVVTAVGAAHMATLGSLDHVAHEKGALVRALPSNGWAILNGDDPAVRAMAATTQAQVFTYGSGPHCDVWAADVELAPTETRFVLCGRDQPPPGARIGADYWAIDTKVQTIGLAGVRAALAAVATVRACGLPLQQALARLPLVEPAAGRLRPLAMRGGGLLLDDSFNAAPDSMASALETVAALPAQRRIALLGGMADLGDAGAAYHEQVGVTAARCVDVLITKGEQALRIAYAAQQAAQHKGRKLLVTSVYTAAAALQALPSDLGPGDIVLVKGAPATRMERVAEGLLHPDLAAERVLARQEQAWRHVRIGTPDRPTMLRIDLDALAQNTRAIRAVVQVPLMAVLKADAYGHGAVPCARTVLQNGASLLGVATLGEALQLRNADIAAPILILGYTPPWQALDAVRQGISCAVFDLATAQALSAAALQVETVARVHVKVDTGMTRLGLPVAEVVPFLQLLQALPGVQVEGLFTHFATSDEAETTFFELQLQRFEHLLAELDDAGLRPPLIHAANSAAALRWPQARFDLVRVGLALYGLDPAPGVSLPLELQPVMGFYTEIAQVRDVPAETPISYGCTFVTSQPARIATIPVGYADGFRRAPYAWREVLVGGKRVPLVGRVCMDYAMIDVSHCPTTRRGDPVVLIGAQGAERITAEEVAMWLQTSAYEVVSAILPRVPRESSEEG